MNTTKEKAPIGVEAQGKTIQADIKLCSGFGQYHTNEADPAKPNKRLTPYVAIGLDEIHRMAENPQSVAKAQAQWMIPSTLPSRDFAEQENNGLFWALWADFDQNPRPQAEIAKFIERQIGCAALLYTSRSATLDNQKGRLIVPLRAPLNGEEYILAAECINDALQAAGFEPDRATERTAQLCYLPNRGAFYEHRIIIGEALDPLTFFADEIEGKHFDIACDLAEAEQRLKMAEANRANFKASGNLSAVEAFNTYHTVEEVLLRAGYSRRGARFRHPHSESGGYSVSIKNGRAYSHSTNDPLHTTEGAHDAFSAWAVLYFGGDQSAAAKVVYAQIREAA